jgi:hypothetical protein
MHNVNRFPSSKLKLDEFFLNWLSSADSQKLVRSPPPHSHQNTTHSCHSSCARSMFVFDSRDPPHRTSCVCASRAGRRSPARACDRSPRPRVSRGAIHGKTSWSSRRQAASSSVDIHEDHPPSGKRHFFRTSHRPNHRVARAGDVITRQQHLPRERTNAKIQTSLSLSLSSAPSPSNFPQVLNLLEDAKAGRPLQAPMLPATPTGQSPLSPSSTQALFSAATTPPLSPQKGASPPRSPVSPAKRVNQGGALYKSNPVVT